MVGGLGQASLDSGFWLGPSLYPQNLTDAIARAAADTLQGPMQAAYREAFQSVVLPAFEKSCQAMFQQINDSFRLGTQECEWGPTLQGGGAVLFSLTALLMTPVVTFQTCNS